MPRISFPKIDWYKTILSLMILLFGSLLLVTTLIVPYIREVRKQNVILGVEKTSHDKAKMRFEEETHKLNDFKKENARFIGGFHNAFNPKAFTAGFGGATLLEFIKTGQSEEKAYIQNDYNVTAGFDNPTKFFDLLRTLDDSNFIAKIAYPIVIASKNGVIYSSFGIKTFALANPNAKRKPSVEEGHESIAKDNNVSAAASVAHEESDNSTKTGHKPAPSVAH